VEIFNASSVLTAEASMSFAKPPRQVTFNPSERLYRLVTIVERGFDGQHILASPWWIPPATYAQITKTAYRTGKKGTDVARSGLAIAFSWNPKMDWLIIVELKKAVYGWVGPAKPQPLYLKDRTVLSLGNLDQAYVPGLAPEGANSSDAAIIMYFGVALG
jgi:hypothetical protein